MSQKSLEAHSIPIPPQLAGLLKQTLGRSGTGFDEGAFLQQLHYWTLNSETTGWIVDGVKWIYNSLKDWRQQFPWMSEYGLRKAIANLKKLGLIQTAQHWITSYSRVMFYCIDYERLKAFASDSCDLVASRCTNGDHVEVRSDRTTETETSSKMTSEQQTVVVQEIKRSEEIEDTEVPECTLVPETVGSKPNNVFPPGSGKYSAIQRSMFPELVDIICRTIGTTRLPLSLQKAISESPERVEPAIAYLKDQQKRHRIQNPAGYLYQAITAGWNISVASRSSHTAPDGFNTWFDWAKESGLVVAATTIAGIHQTLHRDLGWMPTELVMQRYPAVSV